uniref:Uncharacterized protein n=1 Tax=Oryza rufipogon TaxID=4529 RepID=A0A0E0NEC1_ORYRU
MTHEGEAHFATASAKKASSQRTEEMIIGHNAVSIQQVMYCWGCVVVAKVVVAAAAVQTIAGMEKWMGKGGQVFGSY